MAASKMAQLNELTECFVCMETYTKPKMLPCMHTFCLKCLQSNGSDKKPGQQVACPLCMKEFSVPDKGFEALPGNFFAEKLLDIQQLPDAQSKSITSDTCDENDPLMQYVSTPFLLGTISSTGKGLYGLTLLGDSLYAVRLSEKYVSQYNSTTLSHVSNIHVADTMEEGSALGIASCVINNCLYVSDCKANRIHRIQLSANNITNWTTEDPRTLSVTQNGNVLVTSYLYHKISEYTTHGTAVRQVDLTKSGITGPTHTILLPTGQFLLCHTGSQHRIVILSADGTILKTYGVCRGSGPGKLYYPHYIAEHNGLVLVGDYKNDKVQLLTGDLTHVRDLITNTHGLQRPTRLCLDEKTGRLFIGSDSGPIQVYQVLERK